MLRSLLFVPGDSERKLAKAAASAADALILDLEDSVAPERLPAARQCVAEFLRGARERPAQQRWVRVNGVQSGEILRDLAAVVGARPDGIVLPKVRSAQDALLLAHYLEALEVREGLAPGSVRIIVITTETPEALLAPGGYAALGARLAGLTWGMEDLSAALGASVKREEDGSLAAPFLAARTCCLLQAAAAKVQAIDGVYAGFRDRQGLEREAERARRDGFTGKLAIHPDQIEPINAAFTPSAEEVERARRIVAAFEATPGAGVVGLDGQMLDRPHLEHARRVLEMAGVSEGKGS
ncbi:MAG: CoA ester lyase [Pseudomonadota bacterium]|nr:MAG: CoA ester lyase [Pseudomonadota bacterium]